MTRQSNARAAGFAFLVYIAAGLTAMILYARAKSGEGAAAKLASLARHLPEARIAILATLVGCFCALILAVTLYAITRDQDPDLAMATLVCRTTEGVLGATSLPKMTGALWLATATGPGAPDAAATNALAAYLITLPGSVATSAIFFAVGSLAFSYLLLKGRIVPVPLAWIGVVASVLVVVGLPLELVGLLESPFREAMWLPMLAFVVPLEF